MELVIAILAVYGALGCILAAFTWSIASRKGRDGLGWFVLTLIFPFAILFALIAPDAARPEPASIPRRTGEIPATLERDERLDERKVMDALTFVPNLDDGQLAARTGVSREKVAQICHRLAGQRRLARGKDATGRVVNRITAAR